MACCTDWERVRWWTRAHKLSPESCPTRSLHYDAATHECVRLKISFSLRDLRERTARYSYSATRRLSTLFSVLPARSRCAIGVTRAPKNSRVRKKDPCKRQQNPLKKETSPVDHIKKDKNSIAAFQSNEGKNLHSAYRNKRNIVFNIRQKGCQNRWFKNIIAKG